MNKTLRILAGVGLCLLAVPFLLLAFLFAQFLPLASVLVSVALVAVVGLWLWLRKRGDSAATESGLMGRQTSKEGLL